jgi:hypothetical protein
MILTLFSSGDPNGCYIYIYIIHMCVFLCAYICIKINLNHNFKICFFIKLRGRMCNSHVRTVI